MDIPSFQLIDDHTGHTVFEGHPQFAGPVSKWKNWVFWTLDFTPCTKPGLYHIKLTPTTTVTSWSFEIGKDLIAKATLSDVIYYFKGQRSAGLLDQADTHLSLGNDSTSSPIDLHGGWYDATGDYGKHLSHLSFSTWFNPQQISLTVWALLETDKELAARTTTDFRQIRRRVLDEAMYGADYLLRAHVKGGSFYRSVAAPGPGKQAKDRNIGAEEQSYRIKTTASQTYVKGSVTKGTLSFQTSYRSGGGLAIASLALASTDSIAGDYSARDYLQTAEEAFTFLEKENKQITSDGKENILDDYCALMAATELYKATHRQVYQQAAEKRAAQLTSRLTSWKNYTDYWRADDEDRPFFHPADAGLPIVSLVNYYPYAIPATQSKIKAAIKRSLHYELAITHEVNNPFGYGRQLVQDTAGHRHSAFFFPHGSEASPWWQGEDARLGSLATAARMAAPLFMTEKSFRDSLTTFATDQLNWILGLNPFDACMLQGTGHNNPAYGFFGTSEYTNAPGGIVNGITSGLDDENDIDFNLPYAVTGKDYDWRWSEQWLPHATWFMLAVAATAPSPE